LCSAQSPDSTPSHDQQDVLTQLRRMRAGVRERRHFDGPGTQRDRPDGLRDRRLAVRRDPFLSANACRAVQPYRSDRHAKSSRDRHFKVSQLEVCRRSLFELPRPAPLRRSSLRPHPPLRNPATVRASCQGGYFAAARLPETVNALRDPLTLLTRMTSNMRNTFKYGAKHDSRDVVRKQAAICSG
jgi:hypothetical protein